MSDPKVEQEQPKKQGFWKKIVAAIGQAIGQAKFGS